MPTTIPPTNTTPASAFVLNGQVPLDGVIDLSGLAFPQRVWFKYTLGSLDFSLATWALGGYPTPDFRPTWNYYLNDPNGIPFNNDAGTGIVETFLENSVGIPEVGSIYISLENGYFSTTPNAPITFYISVSSNAALPAGSILVNNDIDSYPMTLVNPDGTPTQVRSFVAGESAAILENGISLWSDKTDNGIVKLYTDQLVFIEDISWPRGHLRAPISSNRTDTFYIAQFQVAPGKITTVSQAGDLGPTEWIITNITYTKANFYHIAPSFVDNDIIYVHVTFDPWISYYGVAKFHKSTQILDSIFLDADDEDYNWDGFYGNEFLVLPDDNFLLMFSSYDDIGSQVRMYNASGTLVRTFTIDNGDINHIAYAGAGYTSFWAWTFTYTDFDSRFTEFRIGDGVILNDFTVKTTSGGASFSSDPTGPANLYGVPECCPFITIPVPLPPYGTPSGGGTPTASPGLFKIVTNKRTDHDGTSNVKIPNPTFKTGLMP